MTISECAKLLARISAIDTRVEVDKITASVWAELLIGISLDDANAAVIDYYRHKTYRIMPANIVAFVEELQAKRQKEAKKRERDRQVRLIEEKEAREAEEQMEMWNAQKQRLLESRPELSGKSPREISLILAKEVNKWKVEEDIK
jgi:hypothetical protein